MIDQRMLLLVWPAVAAFAVGVVTWLVVKARSRARSRAGSGGAAGAISPGVAMTLAIACGGLAMAALGATLAAHAARAGPQPVEAAIGGLAVAVGLAVAAAAVLSATPLHAVSWTADAVSGPSQLVGLALGWRRARMAWSDIAAAGKTTTGYWYVQAADGARIYWNDLYRPRRALAEALRRRRPDIALPEEGR